MNKNTFIIKKMDRRNIGHQFFNYSVSRFAFSNQLFYEMRNWCWQTWGPSKEMKDWVCDFYKTEALVAQNTQWSWQNDEYYRRIYLASEQELVLFKLRWE